MFGVDNVQDLATRVPRRTGSWQAKRQFPEKRHAYSGYASTENSQVPYIHPQNMTIWNSQKGIRTSKKTLSGAHRSNRTSYTTK